MFGVCCALRTTLHRHHYVTENVGMALTLAHIVLEITEVGVLGIADSDLSDADICACTYFVKYDWVELWHAVGYAKS